VLAPGARAWAGNAGPAIGHDHLMALTFERLFAFDRWANRELLRALRAAGAQPRALELTAHLIAAELLWLARIDGRTSSLPVWPQLTFEQCETHLAGLERSIDTLLSGLTAERLAQPIRYTNSKGERWTSTIEDILIHLVTHSTYHRGQIASVLRQAGHQPAYTDWIHGARQGLFDGA
jgi:uncharacterized damage-inducible protein DinB